MKTAIRNGYGKQLCIFLLIIHGSSAIAMQASLQADDGGCSRVLKASMWIDGWSNSKMQGRLIL